MHVAKWGNPLAVRLPKTLVELMGLKAGDEVSVVAASKKGDCDREARPARGVRASDEPIPLARPGGL